MAASREDIAVLYTDCCILYNTVLLLQLVTLLTSLLLYTVVLYPLPVCQLQANKTQNTASPALQASRNPFPSHQIRYFLSPPTKYCIVSTFPSLPFLSRPPLTKPSLAD